MINKTFKIINNKFPKIFKFIFFLRYLLLIFFVAIGLFLFMPHFFDYNKKEGVIKSYLTDAYGLEVKSIGSIQFFSFPTPHLKIDNVIGDYFDKDIKFTTQTLTIYPKIFSIYNYRNFQTRKIKFEKNGIDIDYRNIQFFVNKILKLKNKLLFKDLNFKIQNSNEKIIETRKISFSNYGYNKNKVLGELFGRKFVINVEDDFNYIDFELLDTGVYFKLNFLKNEKNTSKGNLKGKVLESNYKFDFILNNNSLNIYNFFFRDKYLSVDSKGIIEFKPFFNIDLNSEIQNINARLLKNLDIKKLLDYKDLIKRLNSQNNISYKSKRFSRNFIDAFKIKSELAYGRLNISKKFSISDTDLQCQSAVNLLNEFPILYFNCSINSIDQKNLFKKLKIEFKTKNQPLNLEVEGNLNILNNKVNFINLEMNNNYKATKEDLLYFKNTFEKIIFNKGFVKMFDITKIQKFIIEII